MLKQNEISKEILISLLKDKGKELKILNLKQKKIEEGYKKLYKDNKNLKKDYKVFVEVL